MNIKLVRPFVSAACSVIGLETRAPVTASKVSLKRTMALCGEIAVVVDVTGHVRGTIALMMSRSTALELQRCMTGEVYDDLDAVGESAIGEIANVISGRAGVELATGGCEMTISPPTVLIHPSPGIISTLAIPMFAVGLNTSCGALELDVALAEAA